MDRVGGPLAAGSIRVVPAHASQEANEQLQRLFMASHPQASQPFQRREFSKLFRDDQRLELNPNIRNGQGDTGESLLHWAIKGLLQSTSSVDKEYYTTLLRTLSAYSTLNPDVQDEQGQTVLHLAVAASNEEVVRYIIHKFRANSLIVDNRGQTPVDLAKQIGNQAVMQLFDSPAETPPSGPAASPPPSTAASPSAPAAPSAAGSASSKGNRIVSIAFGMLALLAVAYAGRRYWRAR